MLEPNHTHPGDTEDSSADFSEEDMPLDTGRLWLAGFAVVMFVLCFTPVPVSFVDLGPAKP